MTYVTAANFGSHRTLLNGNVYRFAGSVSYTADRGENAMTVADGATVVIAIPAGVSVRLTGGDALLRNGAGAGIEVPGNATLTICGEGELIATGGAAYEGASGESGNGAGYIDGGVHLMYAGEGGNGGRGGGGAGAGIGGRGGEGGNCKIRNSPAVAYYDGTAQGAAGSEGNAGGAGGACGTVIVRGNVKVTATSGAVPASQAGGGGYSTANFDYGNHSSYFYVGYSGGGGGGGGSGCRASGIGGGGGGGGSGGSGGSGGVTWFYYTEGAHEETGDGWGGKGGFGGVGGSDGASAIGTWITAEYNGKSYQRDSKHDTLDCALGGAGGAAGARGGDGSLAVSASASLNGAGGAVQDPAIDGVSVWACAGDGWTFDPASGKVTLGKNGSYTLTGDVTFENAHSVKLTGLKPGVSLNASGIPGITSLATDGSGMVEGLFLIDGNYNFTLGDAVFSFTADGSAAEFAASHLVSFALGADIRSVAYSTDPDVVRGTATTNFALALPQGTKITLDVECADEYEYRGEREFATGLENVKVTLDDAVHAWFSKVDYRDAQGNPREAEHVLDFCTRTNDVIGGGNWYAVNGNAIAGTITVSGEANLILCNGATLRADALTGEKLVVYGQADGIGSLGVFGAVEAQVKNARDEDVYCVMVEGLVGLGGLAGVGGLEQYGITEACPIGGKVRLWLPNGTHVFVIDGMKYRAIVENAATVATRPTCGGGEIAWSGAENAWIVTPTNGATAMTIEGLPEGDTVAGAYVWDRLVPSGAFRGFGADGKTFSFALDPNGVVNETPVKPRFGDLAPDDGQPFAVGADGATLKFKTINGLYYELVRSLDGHGFGRIGDGGIWLVGDGGVGTLQDTTAISPTGAVLYALNVSRPILQKTSESEETQGGPSTPTPSAEGDVMVIQFSTVGPDKYADGSTVMDGESYALVWTPTGSAFQGIGMDGVALGDSKLVVRVPFATDGHCPNVQFQIDAGYAAKNYPNGTWGIYLLDTRTVEKGSVKIVANGMGNVFGCVADVSDIKPQVASVAGEKVIDQTFALGIQLASPPTIKGFELINELEYLFLQYSVLPISPVSTAPSGVAEMIIVRPKKGEKGFFRVGMK